MALRGYYSSLKRVDTFCTCQPQWIVVEGTGELDGRLVVRAGIHRGPGQQAVVSSALLDASEALLLQLGRLTGASTRATEG